MELILSQDKVTKNKVVRFADGENHNIYLQPDEVQALGNPQSIKLTVEAASQSQGVVGSWLITPVQLGGTIA